jgi:hypothetical protein
MATKIGAAEIGLMTEKRDEKASRANCCSEGVSIVAPHYQGFGGGSRRTADRARQEAAAPRVHPGG